MLLIGNGTVLTMGQEPQVIADGAVLVEGEKILQVGKTEKLRLSNPTAHYINARGKLIMPGLVNAHTHLYRAFAKGMGPVGEAPRDLPQILKRIWWKLDKELTVEDIYYSAMVELIECIKDGVTTVIDHHSSPSKVRGSMAALSGAVGDMGVKACLCCEVSDRDGATTTLEGILENAGILLSCQDSSNSFLRGLFGLHASFTLSDETLRNCSTVAAKFDAGFHVHAAEGMVDQEHSLAVCGSRVLERLNLFGILGPKTIAAHCVHVDSREMDLLRQSGTWVVHTPQSSMAHAVGAAPAVEMLAKGVAVALGTDGFTCDMFESAKAANLLHKHACNNPSGGEVEVQQMLYVNNPRLAAGMFGGVWGVLGPGAWADIIVVDYLPSIPIDDSNWPRHLLYGVSGRAVETTVINGQVRMLERRLTEVDENAVYTAARECAAGLWRRLNHKG